MYYFLKFSFIAFSLIDSNGHKVSIITATIVHGFPIFGIV